MRAHALWRSLVRSPAHHLKLYGPTRTGSMTGPVRCPTFPPMRISVARNGVVEWIDLLPSKIIGIGSNYRAHAVEMGKGIPEEPLMFLKPPSALLPLGGQILRPA